MDKMYKIKQKYKKNVLSGVVETKHCVVCVNVKISQKKMIKNMFVTKNKISFRVVVEK